MAHYSIGNEFACPRITRVSDFQPLPDWKVTRNADQHLLHGSGPNLSNSHPLQYSGADHVPVANHDVGTRFGRKLREIRRTHRMTQLDLAVLLGIDRSYISEVECGKKGISLATLEVIALGFQLPLSDLLKDI